MTRRVFETPTGAVSLKLSRTRIMPGPRNSKRRGKLQAKKEKRTRNSRQSLESQPRPEPPARRPLPPTPSPIATPIHPTTPPTVYVQPHAPSYHYTQSYIPQNPQSFEPDVDDLPLPKRPFIEDPGNGPRVRDVRAFLSSSFASPPSMDDPLCAEFAQDEVLQMLCSVLPEETATVRTSVRSYSLTVLCNAPTDSVVQ